MGEIKKENRRKIVSNLIGGQNECNKNCQIKTMQNSLYISSWLLLKQTYKQAKAKNNKVNPIGKYLALCVFHLPKMKMKSTN